MNWTRFNKYLYKYWKLQAVVIILGLITVPLSLANPYLTKLVIDKAYGNKDLKLFFILALIGGSIFIFNGMINSFSSYLSQRINRYVHFDIAKDLFKHLQYLPLNFLNNHSTGEHIYRITADVGAVSNFVCNFIPQILTLCPRLLFTFAVVFYLNPKLALLAVLLVPAGYIHLYFLAKLLREITGKTILKAQGIFEKLQEIFSHIHLIKALGKERNEIKKFEETFSQRIVFELKNAKFLSLSSFLRSVLNKVISGIIALYGGYQVIKGTMTLGSLTAVMIYLTQLIGLLKSIGSLYETTTINSVNRRRLQEILDIKPTICDAKDAIPYNFKRGQIEFKDIFFGYKKDELVLKNISFLIEASSKVALVGLSGSGKTSVLSLTLRLYEQEKGAVLIDGIDTSRIKLNSLKSQIGIALQGHFLWNDTIQNNILYGAEDPSYEEMIKAAKQAEAHNFIMNFPNGYETKIGEMACKISEGQKQRVAIARALIKRPKILILDEAMSSLDSETEDKVIDNIMREFKESTIIVVSHRLSTARKMGLIYFLKDASSMEMGTHEELLEKSPRYRELFSSQIQALSENKILT